MFKGYAIQFEDELLLFFIVLSYTLNMIMLVKDDNAKTKLGDWMINLASTFLWSPIAYYTAIAWLNIGFRMILTVAVTMIAHDITKLIIDRDFRKQMVAAIGGSIINTIKSLGKKEHDHE